MFERLAHLTTAVAAASAGEAAPATAPEATAVGGMTPSPPAGITLSDGEGDPNMTQR